MWMPQVMCNGASLKEEGGAKASANGDTNMSLGACNAMHACQVLHGMASPYFTSRARLGGLWD